MEPGANAIESQATDWVVRLDAGLTPAEQSELEAWIAADPRHHGAYVRARSAWLDADRVGALAAGAESASFSRARTELARPRQVRFLAMAAAVVLACAGGFYVYELGLFTGASYASEIGEVRRIELPDGSQLTLNTNTRATVHLREQERVIALEHGEALFKVAHDASRPFVVRANDVQVKAIGTAFTVRIDDARVDVLVTEGVVEVSRGGASPSVQRIAANHRAVIASRESRLDVETLDSEGVTRQLAWREGKVAFRGEPLSVAVAEMNRHSRYPIHIDDPALAAQPVIGVFHASDAEAFAGAAAATFGAEITRVNGALHLRMPAP